MRPYDETLCGHGRFGGGGSDSKAAGAESSCILHKLFHIKIPIVLKFNRLNIE